MPPMDTTNNVKKADVVRNQIVQLRLEEMRRRRQDDEMRRQYEIEEAALQRELERVEREEREEAKRILREQARKTPRRGKMKMEVVITTRKKGGVDDSRNEDAQMDVDKDSASGTTEKDVRSPAWCKMPKDRGCEACKKANVDCEVDWKPISEWRKIVELGRVPTRAPAGTGCKRCQSKKHSCFLPATKALWEASKLKRTESSVATAVPSHSFAPEPSCSPREEHPVKRAQAKWPEVLKMLEEETELQEKLLSLVTKLVQVIGATAAEAESSSNESSETGSSSEIPDDDR